MQGRTKCHSTLSQPAGDEVSTPGVDMPPTGKKPGMPKAPTPKTMSSIMPSQNSGMEYNVSVVPVETLSKRPPGFHPARMPSQIPMIEASTMAVPSSRIVGQMRSPMSSQTGREKRVESMPGSKGLEMYVMNCSHRGLLRSRRN